MINITKQGNNVIVTSDNPNSFHIGNGELSVPLNTIYYVLDDESDFIQFNSTEKGKILFNGTIGDIQVNGNIVNRENILMELDNVFNSAATGGEGGTAGVLSINGYDGNINLKSINGKSLIGSGNIEVGDVSDLNFQDNVMFWNGTNGVNSKTFKTINGVSIFGTRGDTNIEISGGEGGTAGVEAINIGEDVQDWTQKTGVVSFYTSMYNGSYDVAVGGMSFFGLKPADDTIIIEQGDFSVNGCFRGSIRVNPDVLGGGSSEPEQYIVAIEDFLIYTKDEPYKKILLQYIDSSNKNTILQKEIILEWTGTQSEYDALGEYDDSITYYIIED